MEFLIPDNYRLLRDEEIITEYCLCFGHLTEGGFGWGNPPSWLVGQAYCEGYVRHPDFIAIKK